MNRQKSDEDLLVDRVRELEENQIVIVRLVETLTENLKLAVDKLKEVCDELNRRR